MDGPGKTQRAVITQPDQQQQFASLLQWVNCGVMAVDGSGKIILFNTEASRLLQTAAARALSSQVREVFPKTCLTGVVRSGRGVVEKTVRLHGRKVVTSGLPIRSDGRVVGALALFKEQAQIRSVVSLVKDAQSLSLELDAIFKSVFHGLAVTDREGRILRVNPHGERLFGCSAADLEGRTFREVLGFRHHDDDPMSQVLSGGSGPATSICRLPKAAGVLISASPIHDPRGEVDRVLVNLLNLYGPSPQVTLPTMQPERPERSVTFLPSAPAPPISGLVTANPAMAKVLSLATRVANTDCPVLVLGETGTGKTILARSIHEHSRRRDGRLVELCCSALPESLIEAELFGYATGAFTGASRDGKPGLIETAHGGTLFLDEIGELPLAAQAKLLKAVEEKAIYRVGATKPLSVDTRIIAATNMDLKAQVAAGRFRADLYYRLNVVTLSVPPLRQRVEDVDLLVEHVTGQLEERYRSRLRLTAAALACLRKYGWPGNVRELRNVLESLVVLAQGNLVDVDDLPPELREQSDVQISAVDDRIHIEVPGAAPLQAVMEEVERRLLTRALTRYGSTRRVAAALGMDQSSVVRKVQKFRL